jgi:DNA-binding MarR family transcriptional regulator
MRKVKSRDFDFDLYTLLRRVNDAMVHARNRELSQYGINVRQASALYMIKALGMKATPAEIARWQYRKPHTVSHLLQKMEDDGLITKRKDLTSRNQVRAVLTEKGAAAYRDTLRRKAIHKILSALTQKESATLVTLLEKLGEAASREAGSPGESDSPRPE